MGGPEIQSQESVEIVIEGVLYAWEEPVGFHELQ